MEFEKFEISFYVSSYPFWYFISLNNSFKKMNKIKHPNRKSIITDVVVRLTKALSVM